MSVLLNYQQCGLPNTLQTLNASVPSGIAPTGTMGANGAVTLGTALSLTYGPSSASPGIWLNFPAGAVASGSAAGSYWTVMTSTTLGTVFNNLYTSPGLPTPPANPIAVVDAGPGAYTGVTSLQVLLGLTIPAGALGPNGVLRVTVKWNYANSAGTKLIAVLFGGSNLYSPSRTTSLSEGQMFTLQNRGSQSIQLGQSGALLSQAAATSHPVFAINTALAQNLIFQSTQNTATDFSMIEGVLVEIIPG